MNEKLSLKAQITLIAGCCAVLIIIVIWGAIHTSKPFASYDDYVFEVINKKDDGTIEYKIISTPRDFKNAQNLAIAVTDDTISYGDYNYTYKYRSLPSYTEFAGWTNSISILISFPDASKWYYTADLSCWFDRSSDSFSTIPGKPDDKWHPTLIVSTIQADRNMKRAENSQPRPADIRCAVAIKIALILFIGGFVLVWRKERYQTYKIESEGQKCLGRIVSLKVRQFADDSPSNYGNIPIFQFTYNGAEMTRPALQQLNRSGEYNVKKEYIVYYNPDVDSEYVSVPELRLR